ncbi:MAG: 2'-5' RNA ligase family protein [Azonexus sp.]|nr:2'-5' RNA ligase family protein [Azonexus sp.]
MIEASHTLRNEPRDFVEWHRGRRPYVFWGLDVDMPAVVERVAAARQHLHGLLLDGYNRQPHITIELCGFAGEVPLAGDEFDSASLSAQVAALRQAAPAPFEIEIGGLASFTSAPYLQVVDASHSVAAVRNCLAVDGAVRLLGDYMPHVTVGLYGDAWPADNVRSRLSEFATGEPLPCRIERISLMAYEPSQIGGPLRRLGDFHLAGREMEFTELP